MTDNTEYLSVSRMRKNRPRLVHDHPRNRLKGGRDSLSLDEKIKRDSGESQKRKRKRKEEKEEKENRNRSARKFSTLSAISVSHRNASFISRV